MRPGLRLLLAALLVASCGSLRDATTNDRGVATAVGPVGAGGQKTAEGESVSDRESGEDTPVSGAAAEGAKAAAQAAVPGATVREVERDSDDVPGGAYKVELSQPDGSTIKVHLDRNFKVIGIVREGRDD